MIRPFKSKERNIYLGSDWHFSKWSKKQLILKYNNERNKDIIEKYKEIVKPNDVFIFLGDLTEVRDDNPTSVKMRINDIKTLPGIKIMIRGNNDYESDSYYKNELKFLVCEETLKIKNAVFTHDPCKVTGNNINIHGHIHGERNYWNCDSKNHVDCFSGVFDWYPVDLKSLIMDEEFIEKKLKTEEQIEDLKQSIFKYVDNI